MNRGKRIIVVTAIAAITGASVPAIASAEKNTGNSPSGPTKQELCDTVLPAVVNTLAQISAALDPGSAAFAVVHGAQEAIYEKASKACEGGQPE